MPRGRVRAAEGRGASLIASWTPTSSRRPSRESLQGHEDVSGLAMTSLLLLLLGEEIHFVRVSLSGCGGLAAGSLPAGGDCIEPCIASMQSALERTPLMKVRDLFEQSTFTFPFSVKKKRSSLKSVDDSGSGRRDRPSLVRPTCSSLDQPPTHRGVLRDDLRVRVTDEEIGAREGRALSAPPCLSSSLPFMSTTRSPLSGRTTAWTHVSRTASEARRTAAASARPTRACASFVWNTEEVRRAANFDLPRLSRLSTRRGPALTESGQWGHLPRLARGSALLLVDPSLSLVKRYPWAPYSGRVRGVASTLSSRRFMKELISPGHSAPSPSRLFSPSSRAKSDNAAAAGRIPPRR